MADRFVIANVRRLPMFARLDSQQLDWVASVTQVQRYEPGEEMFQQGAVAQGMMMPLFWGENFALKPSDLPWRKGTPGS